MRSNETARLLSILLLTFLTTINFSFAQDSGRKSSFDSSYYYIATTLSATNIDKAIASADSLLATAGDSLQKIRGLMLLATLNERTGKHTDALAFAIEGEKLAEKVNNKQWQIRIAGFLSTTFRELGLITEGKKYITIAENANNDADALPLMKVFIHQEKAYYDIESRNYHKALAEISQAINISGKLPPNKGNSIIIATCYQIGGFCFLNLDSLAKAKNFLATSLATLGDQESELKGYIYQNLGELALRQKNYANASGYLDSALSYTSSSKNFNLRLYTYKSLENYYAAVNDNKNAMKFQGMYTGLVEDHAALTKNVSNGLIEKMGYELERKTARNDLLYVACGILIIAIVFFITYFSIARKAERKKYLDYITKLKAQKSGISATVNENTGSGVYETFLKDQANISGDSLPENPVYPETDKKEGYVIPKETEDRILSDLERLEQEGFYLKNNITLSHLSAILEINYKYLSTIINKHKCKDFNNYINELRINYIIEKLQTDPKYLEYKIAYLSQESGFSTHSKFTAAFKSTTGISPSAFISNIKKDNPGFKNPSS